MIVSRTKCDNYACESMETAENEKPYVPPYGWIRLKGDVVGTGPSIDVVVCSLECLEPAVQSAIVEGLDR